MITIVMTAYNRPHYLHEALSSLAKNDLSSCRIIFQIEPEQEDTFKVCHAFSGCQKDIIVNKEILGIRKNPYILLKRAFEEYNTDYILYLEDDVILSRDAIDLAQWYFSGGLILTEQLNSKFGIDIICLNLLNYHSSFSPDQILLSKEFNALGVGISKRQWHLYFKDNWFNDNHHIDAVGWDWSIRANIDIHDHLYVMVPTLSRSNHIGREGGMHCSAEFHDRVFGNLQISPNKRNHYYLSHTILEKIMPHSDRSTHAVMVKYMKNNCKGNIKILDCGIGSGFIAEAIHDKIDGNLLNIIGLEICSDYIHNEVIKRQIGPIYHHLYDKIIDGPEANFAHWLDEKEDKSFDVIIFGDSLEHVGPEWAEHSLSMAIKKARYVFVNAPIIDYPQGTAFGNEWETHHLFWKKEHYEMLGGVYLGGNEIVGCFIFDENSCAHSKLKLKTKTEQDEIGHSTLDSLGNILS